MIVQGVILGGYRPCRDNDSAGDGVQSYGQVQFGTH
jgi:hypothetical protein